ncbi:MAG TPA: hypothetical protein VEX38_05995 [Fimbriimonadaceae bacterium]|nr:hypothetical protein [Fimbriimonadaceae bacterium]
MKTGNPKQVTVLAIVAVLAVGFVIYQALPKIEKAAPQTPTQLPQQEQGQFVQAGLPQALIGDPFTHPALFKKLSPAEKSEEAPPKLSGKLDGDGYKPARPDLSDFFYGPFLEGDQPGENAGNGQQSQQEPKRTALTLSAILATEENVALIAIDDEGSKRFGKGARIGPATVVSISDSQVVLSYWEKGKPKRIALRVGQKVEL